MKTKNLIRCAMVFLLVAGVALAQEQSPPQTQPGPGWSFGNAFRPGAGPGWGVHEGFFSQVPGMGPGPGDFGLRGFLPILLDLTEQQMADAEAISDAAREQAQPIHEQLVEKRKALHEAIKANNTAEIDKLSAEIGQLSGQLVAIHAKARASFYQLLTPEQKEKLNSIQERMQNWRGRGMRRRGGV